MDFSETSSNKKSSSSITSVVAAATSSSIAGLAIGCTVEVKEHKINNNNSSEISVRLEQDLDETSQSSVGEDKFVHEKVDTVVSCSGKVFLRRKASDTKTKKTILRLPQVSTCRIGKDR